MTDPHTECFEQVIACLREPLLVASGEGRILAVNTACTEALTTGSGELVGAPVASYAPSPPVFEAGRAFVLRGRDGRRFMCTTSRLAPDVFLLRLSGGPDAEPRERLFREALSTMDGFTAAASLTETLDAAARALLAQGMGAVGALAGALCLVDRTGQHLELIASQGYEDELVSRFRLVPLTASVPIADAAKKAAPVFLETAKDFSAAYADLVRAHPGLEDRPLACMPLEVDGRCIGVLGMAFPSPSTFGAPERERLQTFARQCAAAFDPSHRVERQAVAERVASRLERLNAFNTALSKAVTPQAVTETIVEMGMTAAGARSCGLWLLSKDGATACLARGVGPSGPRSEDHASVPLDQSARLPILDAMRDGVAIWMETCGQLEEQYPHAFRLFSKGTESSLACVPLFVQGRCIGGLSLNYAGAHRFLDDERGFLQVIAQHAATAVERARLYAAETRAREAAEASSRRSSMLARASALLAARLDDSAILAAITESAVPSFGDSCTVELAKAHVDPALLSASSMVVPISARGETAGAIRLQRAGTYDALDLETAEELGRRVGLALDNARLYRDAREADQRKDEFLAMLGHELRNPLAPICSALDMMKLRGDASVAEERDIVSRHVGHLVRLVDELLDVSRISRGKVELKKAPTELAHVIAAAVEMARPIVDERRHRLTVSTPERPTTLDADAVRLAQAVANILINAAKYTDPGGAIRVDAVADTDVVIEVHDSGRGISADDLPNVFDLFVQGPSSLGRAQGGLGVGLTVAKSIVELHGGSLSARSDGLGLGSAFAIRLPLGVAQPGSVTAPPAMREKIAGLRVLVVDDNADAANMVGRILGFLGCSIRVVHDGASALTAFADFVPDCVLLDIGLPDIDGYEVARRLRLSGAAPHARLVALTGYGKASDRARALEAGFTEHVAKPVDIEALEGVMARCRAS